MISSTWIKYRATSIYFRLTQAETQPLNVDTSPSVVTPSPAPERRCPSLTPGKAWIAYYQKNVLVDLFELEWPPPFVQVDAPQPSEPMSSDEAKEGKGAAADEAEATPAHEEEEEVEEENVTPLMQLDRRADNRKTLKRGRKAGKSRKAVKGKKGIKEHKPAAKAKGKAKGPRINRKPSKRVLKGEKLKGKNGKGKVKKSQPKETEEAWEGEDWASNAWDGEAFEGEEGYEEKPKVSQGRVELGKGAWRYEVLDDQIYGCSNCRFIYGGCKVCKRPQFRGRSAARVREELAQAAEAAHGRDDDAAPRKRRKKAGKVKAKA